MKQLYTIPKQVGRRAAGPAVFFAFLLGMIATSFVMTEALAAALGFNPALGRPVWPHVWAFWAWAPWAWAIYGPLGGWALPAGMPRLVPIALGVSAAGGFVGTIVSCAFVSVLLKGNGDDVASANDAAHFATDPEIKRAGLFDGDAGPIIGARPRFFGIVRRAMTYAGELGMIHIAPAGDGKTTSLLVNNLLRPLRHKLAHTWDDFKRRSETYGEEPSWFITDPSMEVFNLTSKYQQDVLGKRVHLMQPLGSDPRRGSFNPFWTYRIGLPEELSDCRAGMNDAMQLETNWKKTYWESAAEALGEAIIGQRGYVSLWKNDPKLFSPPGITDYIQSFNSIDDMLDDLINTPHDPHQVFGWKDAQGKATTQRDWIVGAAKIMKLKVEEEKSGCWNSMTELWSFYRSELIRACTMTSSFSFDEMADSEQAGIVYYVVKFLDSPIVKPFTRMVVRAAYRSWASGINTERGRTLRGSKRAKLMGLDEFIALGPMPELEDVAANGRKHGLILWLFAQAQEQIARLYPHASFQENIGVHVYGRPQLPSAAKPIADGFGTTSQAIERVSVSEGKQTTSVEIHTRPNMTANELTTLPDDEVVVRCKGLMIRGFKFSFFLNRKLQARAELGAALDPVTAVIEPQYHRMLRDHLGPKKFAQLFQPPPAKPHDPSADDWRVVQKLEMTMPRGSRVVKTDYENKPDGKKMFALTIVLSGKAYPIIDEGFKTPALREVALKKTLAGIERLDSPPKQQKKQPAKAGAR
jgi:type IV secretory pathway TraG/TraD family ATPase VirD4